MELLVKKFGSKYIQDHVHIVEGSCGNVYYTEGGASIWLNKPAQPGEYKEHAIQMIDKAGNIIPTGNSGNIQPSKVVGYMWIRTA